MADIRELRLNLTAKSDQLTGALNDSQIAVNKFGKQFQAMGRKATLVLGGLTVAGFGAVKSAEDVAVANARLGQILEDMGVQFATKRVTEYAESLERTTAVDAEVIKLTQAKLATFANLNQTIGQTGGAFDRATKAAIDMAAAGFGEASQNAVQLGKALQDPIKGINALTRSGITFTKQEKANLKALVEGGADYALQAMGLIESTQEFRDELKAQKGDVQAVVKAYTDEMTPAQIQLFEHLQEGGHELEAQDLILKAIEKQVGGTAEATATSSQKMRIAMDNLSESIGAALLPSFQKLVELVTRFTPALSANANAIVAVGIAVGGFALAIKTLQFGIEAVNTVIKVATALQWLFNAALAANPVTLLVIAFAALAAGVVIAYNKFEPFKKLVDDTIESVKKLGSAIANSPLGKLVGTVVKGLTGGRATGGSVNAGGVYRVGEFGPETLVMGGASGSIRRGDAGGSTVININGIVDAESARRSIERLLQDSGRRTAAVNLVGSSL